MHRLFNEGSTTSLLGNLDVDIASKSVKIRDPASHTLDILVLSYTLSKSQLLTSVIQLSTKSLAPCRYGGQKRCRLQG
jgi:hypothetical protein